MRGHFFFVASHKQIKSTNPSLCFFLFFLAILCFYVSFTSRIPSSCDLRKGTWKTHVIRSDRRKVFVLLNSQMAATFLNEHFSLETQMWENVWVVSDYEKKKREVPASGPLRYLFWEMQPRYSRWIFEVYYQIIEKCIYLLLNVSRWCRILLEHLLRSFSRCVGQFKNLRCGFSVGCNVCLSHEL